MGSRRNRSWYCHYCRLDLKPL